MTDRVYTHVMRPLCLVPTYVLRRTGNKVYAGECKDCLADRLYIRFPPVYLNYVNTSRNAASLPREFTG